MSSLLGDGEKPVYRRKDEENRGEYLVRKKEEGGYFGKPPWERDNDKYGIDVDRFYENNNNENNYRRGNGEK